MRRVIRRPLSPAASAKLDDLTRAVADAPLPKKTRKVTSLWNHKPDEFDEIRQVLVGMAHGRARCMYCEDDSGTDIEHFWPKSVYPHLTFTWLNYLLACSHCNSSRKGREFPLDHEGNPLLLDPSVDEPTEHLRFLPSTGEFEAIGPKGPESIRIFGLNDGLSPRQLPTGRCDALSSLVENLFRYDRYVETGNPRAAKIREVLARNDFSSVFVWLIRIPTMPEGPRILGIALGAPELGPDICAILTRHRVAEWIPDA